MRGIREVRRGGCGLIALIAVGCGGVSDQSWRPSMKRNVIGRELVVVETTRVPLFDGDLRHRNEPNQLRTLTAGTRLRVSRAYHVSSGLLPVAVAHPNGVLVTIVGDAAAGFADIAGYRENPTRLSDVIGPFLLLPRVAPAWLDLSATPPSAAAADVATLRAAVLDRADDATPTFAARELVRRSLDDAGADRDPARRVIGELCRPGLPIGVINAFNAGLGGLSLAERQTYFAIVRAATQPTTRE